MLLSYTITNQSVGYDGGAVWINSSSGNTNTVDFIDGVADNPVSTLAAALTIGASVGLNRYKVSTGSVITVPSEQSNIEIIGFNYHLDAAGFALNDSTLDGAIITSTVAASTGELTFWRCLFGDCSIPASNQLYCAYGGTMTLSETGRYLFNDSFSAVAGGTAPIFDCGGVGNQQLNFRHASMGIELQNFGATGTDTASIEGHGQLIIASNCDTGGTIYIRGHFKITDNASGKVTLVVDANFYDTKSTIDEILNLAERDEVFAPVAGTVTYFEKGTANQIGKKDLKDPDGNAVNSTEDIIAESREA
jgi:hypothetical protein